MGKSMLFTVILHIYGHHIEETACKLRGPVWFEITVLKIFHMVM